MNLRIIKAGVLDSLQDDGRYGWQHLGINPGGVMDKFSARMANILAGNPAGEAVIELHFPASAFFFEQPALIAIAGADFSASINGEDIPRLQPILVSKYSILQFQRVENGSRAYLAVHGGFNISPWLNSLSTNLKAGAGGYLGRTLQKDDEIALNNNIDFSLLLGKKEFVVLSWKAEDYRSDDDNDEIAILRGIEWDNLESKSQNRLLNQSFLITGQSDRMGYHLNSEPLSGSKNEELVSSAVCSGTLQLLPDGQLILLMADHQTTGGYPRIANIISAHHSRLAQMKPGETMKFRLVDQKTAEDLFIKQQKHLLQLENACKFKLDEILKK